MQEMVTNNYIKYKHIINIITYSKTNVNAQQKTIYGRNVFTYVSFPCVYWDKMSYRVIYKHRDLYDCISLTLFHICLYYPGLSCLSILQKLYYC